MTRAFMAEDSLQPQDEQLGGLQNASVDSLGLWNDDLNPEGHQRLGLASDASELRLSRRRAQTTVDAAFSEEYWNWDWNWALGSEGAVDGGDVSNDGIGGGIDASPLPDDDGIFDQLWPEDIDEVLGQLWAGDLAQDAQLRPYPQHPSAADLDPLSVPFSEDDVSKAEDASRQKGGGAAGKADKNCQSSRRGVSPFSLGSTRVSPVHLSAAGPLVHQSTWELPSKRHKADSSQAHEQHSLTVRLAEVMGRIQRTAAQRPHTGQVSHPAPAQDTTKETSARNTSGTARADEPSTTALPRTNPTYAMLGAEAAPLVCQSYPVSLWWSQRVRRRRALLHSVGLPPNPGMNAEPSPGPIGSSDPAGLGNVDLQVLRGSSNPRDQASEGRRGAAGEAQCFTLASAALARHPNLPPANPSLSRRNHVSLDPSSFTPPPEAGALGARVKKQLAALGEAYATGDLVSRWIKPQRREWIEYCA